jgi:hypothetical protein
MAKDDNGYWGLARRTDRDGMGQWWDAHTMECNVSEREIGSHLFLNNFGG